MFVAVTGATGHVGASLVRSLTEAGRQVRALILPDVYEFSQGPPQSGRKWSYSTEDTGGCSCEQIIDALGLGKGHLKHGCSNGAMSTWVERLRRR